MSSLFEDIEAVVEAYEDVRNNETDTAWAALCYEGKKITFSRTGTEYAEFLELLQDDQRIYGYVRYQTGDEMSKRTKFVFITWIGPSVPPLKKAKVSTDKAFVKEVFKQFGKEILADDKSEVKYEKVLKMLEAASGAAYGTGK